MEQAVFNDRERSDSYKILAECYYPPDDLLLKTLGDSRKATSEFLSKIIRNAPKADDLESHKVDYSRLFLGPFRLLAPPYGSVYLEDGQFMGQSTIEAADFYREEDLDIVVRDAPDHISVELEFMSFLVLKETEARKTSDVRQVARVRNKQAAFLVAHLGAWIQPFTHNIETNAQTEFYKALGCATRHFVLEDLGKLSEGSCPWTPTQTMRGTTSAKKLRHLLDLENQ